MNDHLYNKFLSMLSVKLKKKTKQKKRNLMASFLIQYIDQLSF